jgi:NAD dependent epimerase/dehydratase family
MRIFLAGASGVVGKHLVPLLREAGHAVVGTTRSREKAEHLRALGVQPEILDALDRQATVSAVMQARPGAIVHQLTAIPADLNLRRFDREFALTNRLRTEGTDNLLAAARAAGVRRVVAQSLPVGPTRGLADPSRRRKILWTLILPLRFAGRWTRFATWKPHFRPQIILRRLLCATAGSTVRQHLWAGAARSSMRFDGGNCRSSATALGSGLLHTSPMQRPRRWQRSSAARLGSITSPTTSPRRFASGCHFWPARLVRRRRDAYPPGWRKC